MVRLINKVYHTKVLIIDVMINVKGAEVKEDSQKEHTYEISPAALKLVVPPANISTEMEENIDYKLPEQKINIAASAPKINVDIEETIDYKLPEQEMKKLLWLLLFCQQKA